MGFTSLMGIECGGIGGDPIFSDDILVCLHCRFEFHPSLDVLWHVGTIG